MYLAPSQTFPHLWTLKKIVNQAQTISEETHGWYILQSIKTSTVYMWANTVLCYGPRITSVQPNNNSNIYKVRYMPIVDYYHKVADAYVRIVKPYVNCLHFSTTIHVYVDTGCLVQNQIYHIVPSKVTYCLMVFWSLPSIV